MEITRLFDIPQYQAAKNPDKIAFGHKRHGEWQTITYRQYQQKIDAASVKLQKSGIGKGDTVATILGNCFEWNIIDMAIYQLGAIHVSIFSNFSTGDYQLILNEAEVKAVIISSPLTLRIIQNIHTELPQLRHIYGMQTFFFACEKIATYTNYDAAVKQVKLRTESISENDIAAIYYTSGTFNRPNGVMVTHRALTQVIQFFADSYKLNSSDKLISYLPLSHSFERGHNYLYQINAVPVYYAESSATVIQNLNEIKPTKFNGVPVLLSGIIAEVNKRLETEEYKSRSEREIFKDITGGKIRIIVCAGAPLSQQLAGFFAKYGIKLFECYGMTETQVIAMNDDVNGAKTGTVGVPVKGVQVKLETDGEILVKSQYMMQGYFKNPELNQLNFDTEGWLHTGDIGEWVEGKYLKITGRKREIFKINTGRYVIPEHIEKKLTGTGVIKQAMVYPAEGAICALIVPAETNGSQYEIATTMRAEVDKVYNQFVPEAEKINNIDIIANGWSIENGELTPSFKLKRNTILKKYVRT